MKTYIHIHRETETNKHTPKTDIHKHTYIRVRRYAGHRVRLPDTHKYINTYIQRYTYTNIH